MLEHKPKNERSQLGTAKPTDSGGKAKNRTWIYFLQIKKFVLFATKLFPKSLPREVWCVGLPPTHIFIEISLSSVSLAKL